MCGSSWHLRCLRQRACRRGQRICRSADRCSSAGQPICHRLGDGACGNAQACCRWRMITQHAAACRAASDPMKLLACRWSKECLLIFFAKVSLVVQPRLIACTAAAQTWLRTRGVHQAGRRHANGGVWDPVTSSTSKQRRQARACTGKARGSSWPSGCPAGRRAQRRRHVMQLPAPGRPQLEHCFRPSAAASCHCVTH